MKLIETYLHVTKMFVNLTTVYLALFLLNRSLSANSKGRLYATSGTYATVGNPSYYNTTAGSIGICAKICYSDELCATFSYDTDSRTCHLSEGLVASGVMFGPYVADSSCPFDKGYRIYVRQKNVLCLKYHSTRVTQTAATAYCQTNTAHLVLIENESMARFVADILIENSWGQTWVDGYDEDDDGFYTTFRGDPLPYVPPGSGMKDGPGYKCIRIVTSPLSFNDLPCNEGSIRYVFCQIDV